MGSLMNPTAMFVPRRNTIFMAYNMKNTELLRTQLHQLHTEADRTRDKASNARLRLMRLSEAAANLQRQAAADVRIGRENEARELLFQKRKVMQALEKSKSRIKMLDELSAKLNEAISVKETELIGNVSSGLDVGREDTSSNIRIISPKEKDSNVLSEDPKIDADTPFNHHNENSEEDAPCTDILNDAQLISSLKDISSYEDFLDRIDKQFNKIEVELVTFLRLSTLVLESEEKPKNSKVQQAQEILENVQGLRKRIANMTKMKARIN